MLHLIQSLPNEINQRLFSVVQKWPALSITSGVTLILGLAVLGVAAAGWPGQVTSNCYEDYLVTADCYCERLRGDKPGDVWFAQPMNTISNLWFIVSGLLIAYAADSRSFPSKQWWDERRNPITQDISYSIVYALTACLLGLGSICLHASFTTWGRQLDMCAMYFLASFSILYPFLKQNQVTKEQAFWLYVLMNAALVNWTFFVGSPDQTRKLFSTMIVSSWLMEIFAVDAYTIRQNKQARNILFFNIAMFAIATVQWKASESGGPLCEPDSLWQGHSLWHFQSAFAIAGLYSYYLMEDIRTGKVLIEETPRAEVLNDTGSDSDSVSS